ADSVRFVVRAHLPQVRACYGRAFKDSSPGGTVEIGFAIDPAGHAKSVRTETNTTDSEGLAHCLEARVREWQFPKPVGGDYELIYPFVFAPGS
ncbi:MAG: AgmX/PglI C-terminal domain-containing protein, partial [Polyangia bacterium]